MKPREFGHLLAQKVSSNYAIDLVNEVESVDGIKFTNKFSGIIIIGEKNRAIQEVRIYQIRTVIWVDRSK